MANQIPSPSINNPFPFAATYLDQIMIDEKFKVAIGIDLGTAQSGTASSSRDNPRAVNCSAPGAKNTRNETKVPTELLRCPDGSWAFGHSARDEYKKLLDECREEIAEIFSDESATERLKRKGVALFRHYKMQLNNKTEGAESLVAKSTMGEEHSLLDLMVKTLEFLSDFALKEVQQGWLRALNVSREDVLWVLTVPAIWNDFGKAFMRKAAYRAGMIAEEGSDHLLLALEPESASIAVHGEGSSYGLFREGSSFLMLDIGGGTADFTLHRVASERPLKLDEIARPTGGPWGGIFVDIEFKSFLYRLFGYDKFKQLEFYHPVDVAEIMDEFRVQKEDFDPDNKNGTTTISLGGLFSDGIAEALSIPSLLELVEQYNSCSDTKFPFDLSSRRVKKQVAERYTLTFSREQMLAFFEPTLAKICDCVEGILREHDDVGILAIVGGYGSSKALGQRIRKEFGGDPFRKTVVIPDGTLRPQAAIVQGAVHFGLHRSVIGRRITKYTYGVRTNREWTEGSRFSKREANWDERKEQLRVKDVFSRIVPQETSVMPFQKFEAGGYKPIYEDQTAVTFTLYRSDRYNPKKTTEPGCHVIGDIVIPCKYGDSFEVAFTFGPEIRVDVTRQDGELRSTTVSLPQL